MGCCGFASDFVGGSGSDGGGGSVVTTISPAALAAGITNDFNPTGFDSANRVRITTNAAGSSLGGMIPNGVDGQTIDFVNLGPAILTIINEEATETTAARRSVLEGAINRSIGVDGLVTAQYDGVSARWRWRG